MEAGKNYWVFMQNSQIGFGGYDFLYGGTNTGITQNPSPKTHRPSPVYNLAGQRLSQPLKGINIQNGKKVVIR